MQHGSAILGYERTPVLRVSFSSCVVATACLPLFGLIVCVFISSYFHFEDSTGTHCQVPNYLPSISASISLSPECQIWRFCIGLHSAPRILLAFTYFKFYKTRFSAKLPESFLGFLNLTFSILENLGLLLLSYVSSSETYFVHEEGFILFILSALIYMLITCRLWRTIKNYSLNPEDSRSHRWKKRFLIFYVACCAFAGFFFWKHNMYCESGSYTMFALFEYLVVLSNMAFHLTAVWDFKTRDVMVISFAEDKDF